MQVVSPIDDPVGDTPFDIAERNVDGSVVGSQFLFAGGCGIVPEDAVSDIRGIEALLSFGMEGAAFPGGIISEEGTVDDAEFNEDNLMEVAEAFMAPYYFSSAKTGENVEIIFGAMTHNIMKRMK